MSAGTRAQERKHKVMQAYCMSSLVSTWMFESGQSKRVSLGLKTKSTKKHTRLGHAYC